MARDPEQLAAALRSFLPDGDRITGVTPLSTGHSNETYRLDGLRLVLRTPPSAAGLLPPYDMARQHAVLAELARTPGAPPVPVVRELCTDPSLIGDAFFLMEQVDGEAFEYEVPEWLAQGPPEVRDRLCAQWQAAMTAVHRLAPLEALGEPVAPAAEAARWRDVAAAAGAASLAAALDRLVAEPPPASGPPTTVWGDPKLANCLWNEGRLEAIVDWELAYNGEPLADLGYVLMWFPENVGLGEQPGFDLPGMWDRKRVIEHWEQATGRSAAGIELHEAASIGKVAAILAVGGHLYTTGQSADERMALWSEAPPIMAMMVEERIEVGRQRLVTG